MSHLCGHIGSGSDQRARLGVKSVWPCIRLQVAFVTVRFVPSWGSDRSSILLAGTRLGTLCGLHVGSEALASPLLRFGRPGERCRLCIPPFVLCAMASSYRAEPDSKVPVLAGESVKDFKTYEKMVKAHVLSTSGATEDEVKRKLKTLGPALYKNLIVMNNSISMLVEQLDVSKLAVENGAEVLLEYLRTMRFSEGKLAQLPRVFRRFYKEAVFKRGPAEPMATFIAEK